MSADRMPPSAEQTVADNWATYRQLRRLCQPDKMSAGTLTALVEGIATVASQYHPGCFSDGALENLVFDIGRTDPALGAPAHEPASAGGPRRVLHLASEVAGIGGLTRTIKHWVALDRSSVHSLVLTRQREPAPEWLVAAIREQGGTVTELPGNADPFGAARALRSLARRSADLVVMQIGGYDTVPLLAFAAAGGPPVAFLNHCDHEFWMGSTVADCVFQHREASGRIDTRRGVTRSAPVPIPLVQARPDLTRAQARAELGIPADRLVLLTVGRAIKFTPTPTQNFFRTALQLLSRLPTAHLYAVGMGPGDATAEPEFAAHPRVHLCGPNPDPSRHQTAADLFLEPYPFGSATALLEACLAGTAPVLAPAPPLDLLATNHGVERFAPAARDETAYLDQVCRLVERADEREALAGRLREFVRGDNTGAGWLGHLEAAYTELLTRPHTPKRVPATEPQFAETDRALAAWHTALFTKKARLADVANNWVFDTAYRARRAGDLAGAFFLLRKWLRPAGFERRFLSALAKVSVAGTVGRFRRATPEAQL